MFEVVVCIISSLIMSSTTLPRLYFGTMTFGWANSSKFINETTALEMIKCVISVCKVEV